MARSPIWKIYTEAHGYVASFKFAEEAAQYVGTNGGEVRHGHRHVVWREGQEQFSASESFDGAAEIMWSRLPGADDCVKTQRP
jgi:hypothetical protein